jgi:hypothetical protein
LGAVRGAAEEAIGIGGVETPGEVLKAWRQRRDVAEEQQVEPTTRDESRRFFYVEAVASSSDEEVEVV